MSNVNGTTGNRALYVSMQVQELNTLVHEKPTAEDIEARAAVIRLMETNGHKLISTGEGKYADAWFAWNAPVEKPMTDNDARWASLSPKMKNFEAAFTTNSGGCRRACECGREFYNPDGGWTWGDGELDFLKQMKATPLPHTVGTVCFDGNEYVADCDCWRDKAEKYIAWLDNHAYSIASYLNAEKRRKETEAQNAPTVEIS